MYTKDANPPASTGLSKATTESTPPEQDFTATTQSLIDGEKTFFMKARIMAGQADLSYSASSSVEGSSPKQATTSRADGKDKTLNMGVEEIEDFNWLSKEEVEATVHPDYWRGVKHMLVAQ